MKEEPVESVPRRSPGLEFGPLRVGDEVHISALIDRMITERRARWRAVTPEYYAWMYRQNPSGDAFVHVARLEGDVVASFALAPRTFTIDGERVVVGKTMDMFTDPACQGQGLMRVCTGAVFAAAAAHDIPGWYVTPSRHSYPIFTKQWGYAEPFSLMYRVRILTPAARRREGLPAGYTVERPERFDATADELWDGVAPGYRVAQIRDRAYLNWRYVENPDDYDLLTLRRHGDLVGIAVVGTTMRRGVLVGEVMELVHRVHDEEVLRLLVRCASVAASRRGCRAIEAWSIPGTRLDGRLRRAGLRWRRGDIKFLLSPNFPGATSSDPESWLLSQGDGNDV